MVVFVRHTLLLGGVGFDINEVTDAVVDEVCGQFDGAVVCIQYLSVVDGFQQVHARTDP